MSTKINVSRIAVDHFKTLKDGATDKFSVIDIATMYGLPMAAAVFTVLLGIRIPDQHIGTLITVFSIFAGLLLNVLILIYSIPEIQSQNSETKQVQSKLLKESFANISYSVIISLASVFLLTSILFTDGDTELGISGLLFFLSTNLALSLLMILKRLYVLMSEKLK